MSNMRLGPWDLKRTLWDQMDAIRVQERKTWRFMLTEACRMFIASRGLVPDEGGIAERYAPAPNVERLPNPAPVYIAPVVPALPDVGLPALPVAVLPASVVPVAELTELTENEKRLERLIQRRATKQAFLDEAPIELAKEPGSLRALNWLKVMPKEVASYDLEIEACKAAIAAEKLAKESSGEMERGEEV